MGIANIKQLYADGMIPHSVVMALHMPLHIVLSSFIIAASANFKASRNVVLLGVFWMLGPVVSVEGLVCRDQTRTHHTPYTRVMLIDAFSGCPSSQLQVA